MATVSSTYTPDNPYQKKIDTAVSQVGSNPEAIKQALTDQAMQSDTQLQEAVQGQSGAVGGMQQLADFHKGLQEQTMAANRAQQQASTALNQQLMAKEAAYNPANAQAFIAAGPQTTSVADVNASITKNPLLSPFAASALASGQQQAYQGTYDLASQMRGSRERAIGSEVNSMVELYKAQVAEKQRLDEEARQKAEQDRLLAMSNFDRESKYAETMGGTVVDPVTGKEYKYMTPQEKLDMQNRQSAAENLATKGIQTDGQGYRNLPQAQKDIIVNNAMSLLGDRGQGIKDALMAGTTSIADILRTNPQFTPAQKRAVAEIASTKWGAFSENDDQLRAMGYNPSDVADLRSGATSNKEASGVDALVSAIQNGYTTVDKVLSDTKDPTVQASILNKLQSAGYKPPVKPGKAGSSAIASKYGMSIDDDKKVTDTLKFITKLKDVQGSLNEAINQSRFKGQRQAAGRGPFGMGDVAIGVTGPLAAFAGTTGSDLNSTARAKITNLQAEIKKGTFGSALSGPEIAEAEKYLPTVSNQEGSNLVRLSTQMTNKMNDAYTTLRKYGMTDEDIQQYIDSITTPVSPSNGPMAGSTDTLGLGTESAKQNDPLGIF